MHPGLSCYSAKQKHFDLSSLEDESVLASLNGIAGGTRVFGSTIQSWTWRHTLCTNDQGPAAATEQIAGADDRFAIAALLCLLDRMGAISSDSPLDAMMRARFESSLPGRLERASRVKLQHFIPAHWFSAAASECASMFIGGYFYGAISVAQAYIEALSRFLAEHHGTPVRKDVENRCRRLAKQGVLSDSSLAAALSVLEYRNDFHHLNRSVPAEYTALELLAGSCINALHIIESEVFAYSIDQPGQLEFKNPEYWPDAGPGMTTVQLRNLL